MVDTAKFVIGIFIVGLFGIFISLYTTQSEKTSSFCEEHGWESNTKSTIWECFKIVNDTKIIRSVTSCGDRACWEVIEYGGN